MTSIDSSLYLSSYKQQQSKGTGSGDYLGKDAFLKILMTQLQNQDPMNPMEDKDFIAQMAQFSTLEQMTNMASSFDKLAASQEQSQMIAYSDFIDKTVKWDKIVQGSDASSTTTLSGTGKIEKVQYKDGSAIFVLSDGTTLEPGNISEVVSDSGAQNVGNGSNSNQITQNVNYIVQASTLIGKNVTWNENNQELTAVISSIYMNNGKVEFEVNDGKQTRLTSDQLLKVSQ